MNVEYWTTAFGVLAVIYFTVNIVTILTLRQLVKRLEKVNRK